MSSITVSDWIQIALLATALFGALAGALNRWATANGRDNLAKYTDYASNVASRANTVVAALPAGSNAAAVKAQLIKEGADYMLTQFAPTAKKLDATPLQTQALIEAQFGKLPNPALVGDSTNAANVAALVTDLHAVATGTVVVKDKSIA